jgi:hypothetical protein
MTTGLPIFTQGVAPAEADWDDWVSKQVVGLYADIADRDTQIDETDDPAYAVVGMRAVTLDDGIEWVLVDNTVGAYVWEEYGRWRAWGTYSPSLDATTTPPVLGTGPAQVGRWRRHGTHATVAIYLAFGTGGTVDPGSGTYEIDLPAECPAAPEWYGAEDLICGNGIAIDASTGTRRSVAVKIVGANTIRLEADGLTAPVTESNLIAWDDSDLVLSATIEYETEPPA